MLPEWAPNSVGVEVTQERDEGDHLGAAEAVNHGTELLAVLHICVLVLLHTEKSGQ